MKNCNQARGSAGAKNPGLQVAGQTEIIQKCGRRNVNDSSTQAFVTLLYGFREQYLHKETS